MMRPACVLCLQMARSPVATKMTLIIDKSELILYLEPSFLWPTVALSARFAVDQAKNIVPGFQTRLPKDLPKHVLVSALLTLTLTTADQTLSLLC